MSKIEISVRVHTSSARNELDGVSEGIWLISVAPPPVKRKSNKELIAFLSQLLGVGKSQIGIIKGHTARNKVIAINGLSQEDIMKRLSPG